MLNERAEFEAYITNPESSSPRIQPKLLTGNFSTDCGLYGIEQILVVLARGYIFDTYRQIQNIAQKKDTLCRRMYN